MPNSNATTTSNPSQGVPNSNGNYSTTQQIPINQHHAATAGMDMPQGYHPQAGFSSPSESGGRQQQQYSPHLPQGFGFDPDLGDMFSDAGIRSHLGRMRDPFGTFGTRKRSGNKNPLHSGVPSYYDDDDADFPHFGSLGRRRPGTGIPKTADDLQHDDFFERLPPEFRQYIPDSFGMRRGGGSGVAPEPPHIPTQQPQYYQTYVQPGTTPPKPAGVPHSPPVQMRNVCDAAIQTEDPSGAKNQSEVDGYLNPDSLNQHGLRNTVDMGVRTPAEGEVQNSRSHSAPPQQQEQNYPHEVPIQQQQPAFHSQGTGTQRNTPPPQQQRQYPPNQQPPRFQKVYYPPTNQSNSQQPATPQTPGGSYIRTIPIFVEGRSEPLINHKDIPQAEGQPTQIFTQSKGPQGQQQQQAPQQQQYQQYPPQQQPQHHQGRPTPINTHQQVPAQDQQGPPPATPHTMESINKIQDIQRDVLNLMSQVEKFAGIRKDKEYAYLDEMLTRNLLKLDTIDTQGKESIRLARKEAIRCIQASINVLEAKAEENAKTDRPQEAVIGDESNNAVEETNEEQPINVSNSQEAIPLPPPESLKTGGSSDNVPVNTGAGTKSKEASPTKEISADAAATTTNVTKSGSGSSTKGQSVTEAKTE